MNTKGDVIVYLKTESTPAVVTGPYCYSDSKKINKPKVPVLVK